MIHKGHENFFIQARALSAEPHLIVSIARDSAVVRHKGVSPQLAEGLRAGMVLDHELVDEVILGDEEGYVNHIVAAQPDIIALGYDQRGEYVDNLEKDLQREGLFVRIVRLDPFQPEIYKTSKLR